MDNMKLFYKIFELNGIIKGMNTLAEHDGAYDNPFIEEADVKMKEIIEIVQEKQLSL
ncbi:hypothetical protein [Cytobacillus gottheilii]|uniref:hypothetical protein n=1 Tax=Cytobacillus gottheilii TaxID=859144 RepID=UPI000B06BDB5|nr:hypothetical protein [Cytobacillus gottheilii]